MSTPMMDQGGQPVNIIGNTQANNNQPITQDASVILVETILSILAFYLAFKTLSSYTTNAIFMQKWQISKPVALDTANKTISAIFATLSSLTGIYVLMTYNGVYYLDCAITYFMPFAMGYFLYDFFAMAEVYMARLDEKYQSTKQNSPETDMKHPEKSLGGFLSTHPLMSAHHLALSLFFIPLMVNRRDHYPGDPMLACALIMEASTPFVSLRAILYNLHLRHSFIYVLNGLFMVLVFFMCRILIYPWFYAVHSAAYGLTFWQAVMKTPPRCATWMILALIPQIYWFKIMVAGALKVVKEKFIEDTKNNNAKNGTTEINDTKTKEE